MENTKCSLEKKLLKTCGLLICAIIHLSFGILSSGGLFDLPDSIVLSVDEPREINFSFPVQIEGEGKDAAALHLNGQRLSDTEGETVSGRVALVAQDTGSAGFCIKLFGIPLRTIAVTAVNERVLIPGGESIGVTLFTKGVLVVGFSDIEDDRGVRCNPAREAGMLSGDVITGIDGIEVEDSQHLAELVAAGGGSALKVTVTRAAEKLEFDIKPVGDRTDEVRRLGVWVRDSTAGVGTLTYYDPLTDSFAGLGHGITDVDTGSVLDIKRGEIIRSSIVEIVKGYAGYPGELKGLFGLSGEKLGMIVANTEFGIYGRSAAEMPVGRRALPIASQAEVEYGPAKLMCTIDESGPREFDCEIIKITKQVTPAQKGLVIQVTDTELLEKTGGIVQGMSGSPIIQNGKIVGAVTHVFLNSPEKGYGIFVEWMLNMAENVE